MRLLTTCTLSLAMLLGCDTLEKGDCPEGSGHCDSGSSGYTDASPDDVDGDGYNIAEDCDDGDASVNPGATEVECDEIDNDCSSDTPDTPDHDGDGYNECEDTDEYPWGGDCDDEDDTVYPGAQEVCDEIDNDCNGSVDDGGPWYPDSDSDGYGDGTQTSVDTCDSSSYGYTSNSSDCDDSDEDTYPGSAEEESGNSCMTDADGDGYGDDSPGDGVTAGTDCNDNNKNTNPAGGQNEEDPSACVKDADGDGYGDSGPGEGVTAGTDCHDHDDEIHPGAEDVCYDGEDTDCDGEDEEDCECPGELRGYWDSDTEGHEWWISDNGACAFLVDRYSYWGDYYDTDVIDYERNVKDLKFDLNIVGFLVDDLTIAVGDWDPEGVAVTSGGTVFRGHNIDEAAIPTADNDIEGCPMLAYHNSTTGLVEVLLYAQYDSYNPNAYLTGTFTDSTTLSLTVDSGDMLYPVGDSEFDSTCGTWSDLNGPLDWNLTSSMDENEWCKVTVYWCTTAAGYQGDYLGLGEGQWSCPEEAQGKARVSEQGNVFTRGNAPPYLDWDPSKMFAAFLSFANMRDTSADEQRSWVRIMAQQIDDPNSRELAILQGDTVFKLYRENSDFRREIDALYEECMETDCEDEGMYFRILRTMYFYSVPRTWFRSLPGAEQ